MTISDTLTIGQVIQVLSRFIPEDNVVCYSNGARYVNIARSVLIVNGYVDVREVRRIVALNRKLSIRATTINREQDGWYLYEPGHVDPAVFPTLHGALMYARLRGLLSWA